MKIIQENSNAELKIGIKNLRTTKKANIVIKCPTNDDGEKFKTAATEKLSVWAMIT